MQSPNMDNQSLKHRQLKPKHGKPKPKTYITKALNMDKPKPKT
jgi:hypothetical protein